MPVVTFTTPRGLLDAAAETRLLERASQLYAEILDSPIDRIRAFHVALSETGYATGGQAGGQPAPYFEFVVLQGRPPEQRHKLMRAFSDLLATETGVDLRHIRGMCRNVAAEDWCIAGTPASEARKDHVARLSQGST